MKVDKYRNNDSLSLELNHQEPDVKGIFNHDRRSVANSFLPKNQTFSYNQKTTTTTNKDLMCKYRLSGKQFYNTGGFTDQSNKILRGGFNFRKTFNNKKLVQYKPVNHENNNIHELYLENHIPSTHYTMQDLVYGQSLSVQNSPHNEKIHSPRENMSNILNRTKIRDFMSKRKVKPEDIETLNRKTSELSYNTMERFRNKTQECEANLVGDKQYHTHSKMVILDDNGKECVYVDKSQLEKIIKEKNNKTDQTEVGDFIVEDNTKEPGNTHVDWNKAALDKKNNINKVFMDNTQLNYNNFKSRKEYAKDLEIENSEIDLESRNLKTLNTPSNSQRFSKNNCNNSNNTTAITLARYGGRSNSIAGNSDMGIPDEIISEHTSTDKVMTEAIQQARHKNRFIKNIVNNFIMVNEKFNVKENVLTMDNKKFYIKKDGKKGTEKIFELNTDKISRKETFNNDNTHQSNNKRVKKYQEEIHEADKELLSFHNTTGFRMTGNSGYLKPIGPRSTKTNFDHRRCRKCCVDHYKKQCQNEHLIKPDHQARLDKELAKLKEGEKDEQKVMQDAMAARIMKIEINNEKSTKDSQIDVVNENPKNNYEKNNIPGLKNPEERKYDRAKLQKKILHKFILKDNTTIQPPMKKESQSVEIAPKSKQQIFTDLMKKKVNKNNPTLYKFEGVHDTEIILADIKNSIDRTTKGIMKESLNHNHYDKILENEYNTMIHKLMKS